MTRIGRNKCHLGLLLIQQLLCIPFPCIVSSANSGWKRLVSQSFYFISYFYTVSWVEIHVHTVVQRKKGTRIKLIIIIHISVDANWATSSTTESGLIQKIAVILKDFSRTTSDFQALPTRNVNHRFVHKCKLPLQAKRTSRLELFAPPVSLYFSVHLS